MINITLKGLIGACLATPWVEAAIIVPDQAAQDEWVQVICALYPPLRRPQRDVFVIRKSTLRFIRESQGAVALAGLSLNVVAITAGVTSAMEQEARFRVIGTGGILRYLVAP